MANPDKIEQDLLEYFQMEENLSKEDRYIYLKAIFNHHFGLDKTTHLVNNQDLFDIISLAKSKFIHSKLPMYVTGQELTENETTHVLLLDAFINYLNKNKLIKKLVNFDYKERK